MVDFADSTPQAIRDTLVALCTAIECAVDLDSLSDAIANATYADGYVDQDGSPCNLTDSVYFMAEQMVPAAERLGEGVIKAAEDHIAPAIRDVSRAMERIADALENIACGMRPK